jgi:hypothetical protein
MKEGRTDWNDPKSFYNEKTMTAEEKFAFSFDKTRINYGAEVYNTRKEVVCPRGHERELQTCWNGIYEKVMVEKDGKLAPWTNKFDQPVWYNTRRNILYSHGNTKPHTGELVCLYQKDPKGKPDQWFMNACFLPNVYSKEESGRTMRLGDESNEIEKTNGEKG